MEISRIRVLMKHEFHRGVTTRQAVININKVFGFQVTTNATVARWFKKFRSGDFDLSYEPRGRPKTQVDNKVLKATVDANPSISARELSIMYKVSKQTILTHLAQIGKVKKLGKWVDPLDKSESGNSPTEKETNIPLLGDPMVVNDLKNELTSHSLPTKPQSAPAMKQNVSPRAHKMTALTQDLDTEIIITKIKEALLTKNISQKVFGEAILGLSQKSVCEVLSKSKPWCMLNKKDQELFIKMQMWLSDAHNIDRLQALKNEKQEPNKKRRSLKHKGDSFSDTLSNHTSEIHHSTSPDSESSSSKKQRIQSEEKQEQFSDLDLSVVALKRIPENEDIKCKLDMKDSNLSFASVKDIKNEEREYVEKNWRTGSEGRSRSSRRKPALPQRVDPEWQEKNMENKVIINGVCVMQADEFTRERKEETIKVEPTAVLDQYSEESSDEQNKRDFVS